MILLEFRQPVRACQKFPDNVYHLLSCVAVSPGLADPGRSRTPELRMNPSAEMCNKLGHRLDVTCGSPEVHDAEPQSVLAGDHSIGNECFATLLYGFQQAPVQFVQIFFRLVS